MSQGLTAPECAHFWTAHFLLGATHSSLVESSLVEARVQYLKELLDEQPVPKKGQPEPPAPTAVTAIVLDGALLEKNQFKQLEKMPTKAQTVTMIARAIKAVPTKVAVGVKAVPTKLARAINCLAELNDDKTMTVEAAAAAKASE